MRQKSGPERVPAEAVVKDIRRATRRQFSAEEKIRMTFPRQIGSGSSWTIYQHTRLARSTKPSPLAKRDEFCAGWSFTMSPSTPAG